MLSYLSVLSQDLTFLETASEISKTGCQCMKEDPAQRVGESEPGPWGGGAEEHAWTSRACRQVVGS